MHIPSLRSLEPGRHLLSNVPGVFLIQVLTDPVQRRQSNDADRRKISQKATVPETQQTCDKG